MMKELRTVPPHVREYLAECVDRTILAYILGCTPRTICRWQERYDMPSSLIGSARLFHLPTVAKWLDSDSAPGMTRQDGWEAHH